MKKGTGLMIPMWFNNFIKPFLLNTQQRLSLELKAFKMHEIFICLEDLLWLKVLSQISI